MPHMLIVDDDFVDQTAVVRTLADCPGITFRCVGNAREGLDYLQQHNVDLVVSDIRMPGINGYEFQERVWSRNPMLPFIFMTGADVDTTSVDDIRNGAQPLLYKHDIKKRLIPLCKIRLPNFDATNN